MGGSPTYLDPNIQGMHCTYRGEAGAPTYLEPNRISMQKPIEGEVEPCWNGFYGCKQLISGFHKELLTDIFWMGCRGDCNVKLAEHK
jgi:hypothetical protein